VTVISSHKLPLNCAAGEDGIFAELTTYADPSACFYLSNLFKVYNALIKPTTMHGIC